MEIKKFEQEDYKSIVSIIKKYANLFKVLYQLDPAIASEFKKKQEAYYEINQKSHTHSHSSHEQQTHTQSSCCGTIDSQIHIPKDKMNNVEKILHEIYSEFFYEDNLAKAIEMLSEKYDRIIISGKSQGMVLNKESEKDLIHRIMLEGVPFVILSKLKERLKTYEESISEQPMLLAHPSGVENNDYLNMLPSSLVKELLEKHYSFVGKKLYDEM